VTCLRCLDSYYLYDGQCIRNNGGLSVWAIVMIVISSVAIIGAIGKLYAYL